MAELVKDYLEKLVAAYEEGNPLVTDEEYDALSKKYEHLLGPTGEVEHLYRMYSLDKHYDKDGQFPLDIAKCEETTKLDGAAVSLLYLEGRLVMALTRGDGIKGRDITDKMRLLVPETIESTKPTQITGEVAAVASITNSRNFASGALNLKEIEEFKQRIEEGSMIFVAYGIAPTVEDTYFKDMMELAYQGFNTVVTNPTLLEAYPTDGIVYRLNDNAAYQAAGFTSKFPKGAFAYKTQQEAVVTTLLEVVWQTGKSGKVTPVAILEPVQIGDATVAKATLNNIEYIEALDLEIGCLVEVIRSGEIIPKIIGRAD
jgi:NAD-dependent DNA ligase